LNYSWNCPQVKLFNCVIKIFVRIFACIHFRGEFAYDLFCTLGAQLLLLHL